MTMAAPPVCVRCSRTAFAMGQCQGCHARRPYYSKGAQLWQPDLPRTATDLALLEVPKVSFKEGWWRNEYAKMPVKLPVIDLLPLTAEVWKALAAAEKEPTREAMEALPFDAQVVWDAIRDASLTVKDVRPFFMTDFMEVYSREYQTAFRREMEQSMLFGNDRLVALSMRQPPPSTLLNWNVDADGVGSNGLVDLLTGPSPAVRSVTLSHGGRLQVMTAGSPPPARLPGPSVVAGPGVGRRSVTPPRGRRWVRSRWRGGPAG